MKMMKFSYTELKKQATDEPYYFDDSLDVSSLAKSENNDIKQIDPVSVKGFVTFDKNELLFSFTISGEMILPCARTLVDVPYSFSIEATEVFTTQTQAEQSSDDMEIHQITEDIFDLSPYIKENIILNMPYRVFSDEKVLDKGSGWDFYQEDAYEEKENDTIDPRLAKLQQLLDQNDEKK